MSHQCKLNFDNLDPKERQRRERTDAFFERYQRAKSERTGNYFDAEAHAEAERRATATTNESKP